jgi:chitin disaccharide deacetylase
MTARYLIVNADDLGQSPGVTRGILRAHAQGIVTSASLMVRWPAAAEAVAAARDHPRLSLGLHVDLGEWACRDGNWVPRYEVVPPGDAAAVADEVARQLQSFRRLVSRDPTHLDSHQHIHLREPARSVLAEAARRLKVPLRHCCPAIRYCGDFYGQTGDGAPLPEAISVEGLLGILRRLGPGVTELACHPGDGDDLDTTYHAERAREVEVLCDARVRATLAAERIELGSFADVAALLRGTVP